ncbi:MAG: hypothetical protein DWQ02_28870 [Bacteroidetes bacterium]|nr:MAG: hypothetical protein DWQ02_28870 [Bacteroidota bacterium]
MVNLGIFLSPDVINPPIVCAEPNRLRIESYSLIISIKALKISPTENIKHNLPYFFKLTTFQPRLIIQGYTKNPKFW